MSLLGTFFTFENGGNSGFCANTVLHSCVNIVSVNSSGFCKKCDGITSLIFGLIARRRESLFNSPPKQVNSIGERPARQSELNGPVAQPKSFSVKGVFGLSAGIPRLFFCRGPSAVFSAIVTVIVYAFKRMFFAWSLPHVGNEGLKTIPLTAKRYSSRTIEFIYGAGFSSASIPHGRPSPVFGKVFFSERHGVILHEGETFWQ